MTPSAQPHPQRILCPTCKGEGYVLSTHSASQQRIEQVIKELHKARKAGTFEEIDNHIDEAIALLQAGEQHE